MEGIVAGAAGAPRDLGRSDLPAVYRFVAIAAFPPWHVPTDEELAQPHVRRWLAGWPGPDDVGVGWEEHGRLRGAALARRVEPAVVEDAAGHALPEVLVAVEEDARGHGVGRALVRAVVERAHARGWPGLALTASPRNPAACAVYRRCGFTEVAAPGLGSGGLRVMVLWLGERPRGEG